MPCRDYSSDDVRVVDNTKTYQEQRDKLARIACEAMTYLEELGETNYSEEARQWFAQHKIADAKAMKEKKRMALEFAERQRKVRAEKRAAEIAQLKKLQAKYKGVA